MLQNGYEFLLEKTKVKNNKMSIKVWTEIKFDSSLPGWGPFMPDLVSVMQKPG